MGRRIRRQKKARDCRSEIHRAGMRASALAGVDEAFSFMERRLATGSERELLPSQQTLPDWKVPSSNTFRREEWLDHPVPDVSAKFAYVAGSELIDEQIRSILPGTCAQRTGNNKKQIHIFGHSHRPKDFVLNGIRYIHNPVGKPVEREMNMINDKLDFQLIWDCTESSGGGEVMAENTITRYWEQYGGGVELLAKNMAKRRRRRRVNKQV